MNDKCQVKVKTPVGDTSRFELNRIEMQGTVPAPLKCAVQIEIVTLSTLECIYTEMHVLCLPLE